MTQTISAVEWSTGSDATETGWWYEVDGVADIVESGTLTADSDRDEVLAAIARKLGVDAVVEA